MLKEYIGLGTPHKCRFRVLILILMEHAQREVCDDMFTVCCTTGLNPYFNGTCSKSFDNELTVLSVHC